MHRRIAPALLAVGLSLLVISPALAHTIYLPITTNGAAVPTITPTPSVAASPTRSPTPTPVPSPIVNGSFERGEAGWVFGGDAAVLDHVTFAHSGTFSAQLGASDTTDTIAQTVLIPQDVPYLRYWSFIIGFQHVCGLETGTITINGTIVKTITDFCGAREQANYFATTVDLRAYRGQRVTIMWSLQSQTGAVKSLWSIDDVSLEAGG